MIFPPRLSSSRLPLFAFHRSMTSFDWLSGVHEQNLRLESEKANKVIVDYAYKLNRPADYGAYGWPGNSQFRVAPSPELAPICLGDVISQLIGSQSRIPHSAPKSGGGRGKFVGDASRSEGPI